MKPGLHSKEGSCTIKSSNQPYRQTNDLAEGDYALSSERQPAYTFSTCREHDRQTAISPGGSDGLSRCASFCDIGFGACSRCESRCDFKQTGNDQPNDIDLRSIRIIHKHSSSDFRSFRVYVDTGSRNDNIKSLGHSYRRFQCYHQYLANIFNSHI